MISKLGPLPSAATISSTSGAMLPASLRTGTTIETAGGAALASVSLMICPTWPRHGRLASWLSASFLWGDKLPGNRFDACERRTGQWPNDSIYAEHEGEPARRVPIAHQQRADRTGDGPDHHVAREVRREHDPAHRDDDGIGPHERPHPRPQDADGHGGRERIDGMAGRQACIFNAPAERAVNERVRTSLDKRSRAADQALPDGEDQARQTDRKEQKPEPHRDRSEHALGHARKRRRGEQRDRGKRKRDRH